MLQMLWNLFNIALLIYLVVVFFQILRLVRRERGLPAAIILIFMMLALTSKQSDSPVTRTSRDNDTWEFNSSRGLTNNSFSHKEVTLKEDLGVTQKLIIRYGRNNVTSTITLLDAFLVDSGFVGSVDRRLVNVSVDRNEQLDKYYYTADIMAKWKLLGIPVYTQLLRYDGTVFL